MNRSLDLELSQFDGLTADQQQRLTEVLDEYLAGLERGQPLDRSQLLARHPDLAEPLAVYLESLDFLQDAAAGFCPAAETLDWSGGEAAEPRQVGDFEVLREIGRGGMGVVYEARQVSLNRRVALKVLPFAALLDSKQIARFRNEAQAAAQLHHPRIVPVFAVGTDRGVHYYAMQYIDGQPLDRAIAELRRAVKGRAPDWLQRSSAGTPSADIPSTGSSSADSSLAGMSKHDRSVADLLHSQEAHSREAISQDVTSQDVTSQEPTSSQLPGPSNSSPSDSCRSLISQYADESREYFRTVARLAIQAAEALHAAHEVGVVHRDIKPSNLLLDADGNLWVTDFGLARCRGDANLTRTGDCIGTMRYMSPEQSRGQSHLVDHRTDIYSLGLTLYELLTLRHALRGEDPVAILRQLDRDQPYRPRLWNSNIPLDLENIVQKAIAKSRDERYATALELADDLQRFLDGRPTIAQKPTWPERTAKWARRHKRSLAVAFAVLVLTAAGLGASTLALVVQQRKTQGALQEAQANFRQFRTQLALTKNHLAMLQRQNGDARGAEAGFEEAIRLQREILAESPEDDDSLSNLAASLSNLSVVRMERDMPLATSHAEEAVALHEKRLRLRPDSVEAACDRAQTLGQLAGNFRRLGQPQRAIKEYRRAITLLEPVGVAPDSRRAIARDLAVNLNNLGMTLAGAGQLEEAEDAFRQALEHGALAMTEESPPRPGDASSLAGIHNNLGAVLERQGRLDDAAEAFLRAVALQRAAQDRVPDDPRFVDLLGKHYQHAGRVLRNLGRYQEALDVTQARRALNRGDSRHMASIDAELAALAQFAGRPAHTAPNTASAARDPQPPAKDPVPPAEHPVPPAGDSVGVEIPQE